MKISFISTEEFVKGTYIEKFKEEEEKKISDNERRKRIIRSEIRFIEDKERVIYISEDGDLFIEAKYLPGYYLTTNDDGNIWKKDIKNEGYFVQCR